MPNIETTVTLGNLDIDVRAEFDFTPGAPASGPSFSSPGDPGYPPEIEINEIEVQALNEPWRDATSIEFILIHDWLMENRWQEMCDEGDEG